MKRARLRFRMRDLRNRPRGAPARAERASVPNLPRLRATRLPFRVDPHIALVALTLLATLITPFIALLMAAAGAHDRHQKGLTGERNLFIALAALNILLVLLPQLRFGLYSLLA